MVVEFRAAFDVVARLFDAIYYFDPVIFKICYGMLPYLLNYDRDR